MTTNPELLQKLSLVVTSSYIYIIVFYLLVHTYNGGTSINDRLRSALPLAILAGLPPFPTFFTKLWVINLLVSKSLNSVLLLLLVLNTALLLAYLNFFIKSKKCVQKKTNINPKKKKNYTIQVLALSIIFICAPEMFMLL